MWETKFTCRKQYLIDRLCSIKAEKTHIDQSTLQEHFQSVLSKPF